jgi:hypothetical protein
MSGVLSKVNIARPLPPKEVVDVPELGGEIIVRGLMLSDRVRILSLSARGAMPISELLASAVVDAENEPVFTADEWEAFGAQHFVATLKLFKKAKELSGLEAETNAKK